MAANGEEKGKGELQPPRLTAVCPLAAENNHKGHADGLFSSE